MNQPPLSDELPPSPVGDPDPDVTPLQRERDELYDRLLRLTAEFDNFRKRTERERREHAEWAAADLLGLSTDVGTLEPGERADLIAVEGAPLRDVTVLKRVPFVMKDGVVFKDERDG